MQTVTSASSRQSVPTTAQDTGIIPVSKWSEPTERCRNSSMTNSVDGCPSGTLTTRFGRMHIAGRARMAWSSTVSSLPFSLSCALRPDKPKSFWSYLRLLRGITSGIKELRAALVFQMMSWRAVKAFTKRFAGSIIEASPPQRLSERTPILGDAIVWSHGNKNRESTAEMTVPAFLRRVTKTELWATDSRDAVEANVVLAGLVDNDTVSALKGGPGDPLNIPYISNPSATTKSANTNLTWEMMGHSDAEASQEFTSSTHQYVAFAVENIVDVQSKINLRAKYTGKAGYVLAAAADTNLASLAASFSNTVGTLGLEPTDDNVLTCAQNLDDANAP